MVDILVHFLVDGNDDRHGDTVDGSEIRRLPVEVGSFSHNYKVLYIQKVVVWDFFHQQYDTPTIHWSEP